MRASVDNAESTPTNPVTARMHPATLALPATESWQSLLQIRHQVPQVVGNASPKIRTDDYGLGLDVGGLMPPLSSASFRGLGRHLDPELLGVTPGRRRGLVHETPAGLRLKLGHEGRSLANGTEGEARWPVKFALEVLTSMLV